MTGRTKAVSRQQDPTATRVEDSFETHPTFALAACRWIREYLAPDLPGISILEPSAGSGAWVAAARKTWDSARVDACEIRESCVEPLKAAGAGKIYSVDFLKLELAGGFGYSLILGNPPYGGRDPVPPYLDPRTHVRHAIELLRPHGYLVFLLKLSFLCGLKRQDFWRGCPLYALQPLTPRLNFKVPQPILDEMAMNGRKPSNDTAEYGLFCWRRGDGETSVPPASGVAGLLPAINWTDYVPKEEK